MKPQFLTLATCALLLLAAGCKPKEEPVDPQKALYGNVPRPEWVAPEDYDYTSSMTAVISMDSLVTSSEDVLAAFIGDECRGIATYDSGLFYLYIAGPGETVTLRYWSAQYTNLFEAKDAFPFVNDNNQGSYNTPFVPNLTMVTD